MTGPAAETVLQLLGIRKAFDRVVAIRHMDLEISRGEVHAICGENGAGKTTLMNILVGIHQPDAGEIWIDGRRRHIHSPAEARDFGVGMVHQHFSLVSSLSVAENVYLGHQPRRWRWFVDRRQMYQACEQLLATHQFNVDPGTRVGDLTVGQRQRVEIIKALAFAGEILILDEPTAVLTPPEVTELMHTIRALREQGRTIVFITHKLREVKAVADRVTVIRRGETVGTREVATVSESEIAQMMVGRSVFLTARRAGRPSAATGSSALELDQVSCTAAGRVLLDRVSLRIAAGEIVGIAGVEGNGQTELAEVIAGLRPATAGTIKLDGQDVTKWPVDRRRSAGLAHIPEDRLDRGLSTTMSVAENLAASNYQLAGLLRRRLISPRSLRRFTHARIEKFDIRGARPDLAAGALSGGNMQKVVVARELTRNPSMLVVCEPTRGVDVGASEFMREQILAAASSGTAVLLISSELSEILALSDRIGVLLSGQLRAVLPAAEADETTLGPLMSGAEQGQHRLPTDDVLRSALDGASRTGG